MLVVLKESSLHISVYILNGIGQVLFHYQLTLPIHTVMVYFWFMFCGSCSVSIQYIEVLPFGHIKDVKSVYLFFVFVHACLKKTLTYIHLYIYKYKMKIVCAKCGIVCLQYVENNF